MQSSQVLEYCKNTCASSYHKANWMQVLKSQRHVDMLACLGMPLPCKSEKNALEQHGTWIYTEEL